MEKRTTTPDRDFDLIIAALPDLPKRSQGNVVKLTSPEKTTLAIEATKQPIIIGEVRRISPPTAYAIEAAICRAAVMSNSKSDALIVVVIPDLPDPVRESLSRLHRTLSQSKLVSLNWMVVSRMGGYIVQLPSWSYASEQRDRSRSVAISTKNGLQFTDVNELLLKHLIYLRVASLDKPVQHWWSGPRSPISDVITLANQSGVGMSAVYRLMKSLKIGMHVEHIFDNMTRGPQLCLVDPAALLNTWLSVASRRPSVPSVPLSPLYPPSTNKSDRIRHKFIDDIWQRHQGKAPFAIGGWSALERYRKKIVAGETPIQLWMKTPHDVEEIMKQENLVVCNPKEAWFHVMVSPTPRSTFAGLIMKEGQAPIVDLWQAALDVCGDPARGSEQAESIARALVREE